MIKLIEEKYLEDIAKAHLLAWQKAFKGILSDDLLFSLNKYEFLGIWKQILQNEKRKNYVALSDENMAVGFISFGSYKENNQWAEIYGIYVHPEYWDQGYGRELMNKAISEIKKTKRFTKIILWVMSENFSARRFYEKLGFKLDSQTRISERKGEQFQESSYSLEF